jgi:heparan-alpha-glucosaminide N-acetyltransferase
VQPSPSATLAINNLAVVTASPKRLTSLDVFRGFTMLFMASDIMRIPEVAHAFANHAFAQMAAAMLTHPEWVGCSPWDLIQPSFMFMVGVALPFSIANRQAKGQPFAAMFSHSLYRALMFILLGIFLRSQARSQTYFTFEDVLTQIGLGYTFLFLLAWTRPKVQWTSAVIILVGYWAAFAVYPLPPFGFDTAMVGVPQDWPHQLTGFAAHWNKNTNVAGAVDQWFLNLFPREKPFTYNGGGYQTLNFIPSLAAMILGLLAGELLRSDRAGNEKFRLLVAYGVLGVVAGTLLHVMGVCPLVKRIWTPSWTTFSTGWALLFLAGFYYLIDLKGYRRWAFPWLVIGMNSMTMYVLVHVATAYLISSLYTHLGQRTFKVIGEEFEPIMVGAVALLILWFILYWMYRRKIFLRI